MANPVTIWPTASVTISAFSPSPPISSPFTSPTRAQSARAIDDRRPQVVAVRLPSPTVTTAARVNVPGTLRSIPPVMITSIWPSAVMARNVPNGAIELGPVPQRRRRPDRGDHDRSSNAM